MKHEYEIRSQWDATMSALNGKRGSRTRLMSEVRRRAGGTVYAVEMDDGMSHAWAFYSSRADAHRDRDGGAPHLAIAVVGRRDER